MFGYRLHLEDGSDAGQATYAQMIYPGEEIIAGSNQRSHVLDLVPRHHPSVELLTEAT